MWMWEREVNVVVMMDSPIDAVFTWIDAGDAVRSAQRADYLARSGMAESSRRLPFVSPKPRLTELYFSLQSLKCFAPWVRTVWVVTQRPQAPAFIDEFPRARVVHHDAIFEDPDAHLPTFSSRAIEANLHRIPGLSESFLYLNDDMFLGRPLEPSDFFRDGKPILRTVKPWTPYTDPPPKSRYLSDKAQDQTVVMKRDNAYVNSNRRVHRLLNTIAIFDPFRPNIAHQATPLTKSICADAAEAVPAAWTAMMDARLRSSDTLTPLPLALFVAFYRRRAVVLPPGSDVLTQVWDSATPDGALMRAIQRSRPHLFCINDLGPHMTAAQADVYWKGLFDYFSTSE